MLPLSGQLIGGESRILGLGFRGRDSHCRRGVEIFVVVFVFLEFLVLAQGQARLSEAVASFRRWISGVGSGWEFWQRSKSKFLGDFEGIVEKGRIIFIYP